MDSFWDFDIEEITLLLAIATVVLAVVTAVMAWQTRRMAKATERVAEASMDAVEASRDQVQVSDRQAKTATETLRLGIQPLLVDVPPGMFLRESKVPFLGRANLISIRDSAEILIDPESPEFVFCSVPLRNVGRGVAVVSSAGVSDGQEARWSVRLTQTVVPPEEIFRVTASIPVDRPELEPLREAIRQGSWEVEVRYGNIDEDDSVDLVTTLSISGTRVRQVAFRWADDDEPFLISGPADD